VIPNSSDPIGDDISPQENHLLEAIEESPLLYLGSACSLFETLIHLFDWFTSHPSISKEAFSKNLELWHSTLPNDNCLPTSYREAYKIIKPHLLPEIVFHVCPNECIIYREEHKDSTSCPICCEPRFKDNKKKTPWKTFHYLPIGPRLVRSFGSKEISYLLQSHNGQYQYEDKEKTLTDIHDSPVWKNAYSDSGVFGGDPRGMILSLCFDGLNPWSKNKTTYSMWPIVLGQINLPRKIRFQFANLWLVGIVPSQKGGCETKNLDPYLEILIDEIIALSNSKLYDE
jgi:hypothetical protein